eukprot:11217545-Lingulodinium_polyedra.AAC.1
MRTTSPRVACAEIIASPLERPKPAVLRPRWRTASSKAQILSSSPASLAVAPRIAEQRSVLVARVETWSLSNAHSRDPN